MAATEALKNSPKGRLRYDPYWAQRGHDIMDGYRERPRLSSYAAAVVRRLRALHVLKSRFSSGSTHPEPLPAGLVLMSPTVSTTAGGIIRFQDETKKRARRAFRRRQVELQRFQELMELQQRKNLQSVRDMMDREPQQRHLKTLNSLQSLVQSLTALCLSGIELSQVSEVKETTEGALQDTTEKEGALQDTTEKEGALQDTSVAEGALQDTTEKEGALQDTTEKEGALQDTTEKEGALQDTTVAEGALQDTTEKEGALQDTTVAEGALQDTTEKEGALQDTTVAEGALQDTTVAEGALQDTTVAEGALQDTTVAEGALQDTTVAEGALQDTTVAEGALQDTTEKEGALQDTTVAEGALQDTTVAEGALQDTTVAEGALQDTTVAEGALQDTTVAEGALQDTTVAEGALHDMIAAQRARVDEEREAEAQRRKAAKRTGLRVGPELFTLRWYKELQDSAAAVARSCEEFSSSKDPKMKRLKLTLTKAATMPVSQISSTSGSHLRDIFDKLDQLLSGGTVQSWGLSRPEELHPQALPFFCSKLAEKFVRQGEEEVAAHFEAAFPIAAVASGIWEKHPAFGELFLAHLHRLCPYSVPLHPRKEEHYKMDETDDCFLKRMSGMIRLYAAVIQLRWPHGSKQGPPPHGLSRGWTWLVQMLNMEPQRDATATLLFDFLEVCGAALEELYQGQFWKLLLLLKEEYLARIRAVTDARTGSLFRLQDFVETSLQNRRIDPPKGQLTPDFWRS
ncbi:uncharacterized protein [Eucyclogobius newberryi]|uniref:uncharacterized protein n=1 Tax=Eucyclogobius newberryi TaxID=166745 RepID=UPI003B5CBC49